MGESKVGEGRDVVFELDDDLGKGGCEGGRVQREWCLANLGNINNNDDGNKGGKRIEDGKSENQRRSEEGI